jgi:hypothetical protein
VPATTVLSIIDRQSLRDNSAHVLRKYCRVDIYIEEGLTLVPRGSEEVQISNGAAIKVNRDKIIATAYNGGRKGHSGLLLHMTCLG